jgi:hypothetical protein
MSYRDDEFGLAQLFQELEPVQGTFPPVYMLGDILIGYNKLEELTVLAARHEAERQMDSQWLKLWKYVADRLKYENSPHSLDPV